MVKPTVDRVALHEAGHAVMAHHFGNEPGDLSVGLRPDDEGAGRAERLFSKKLLGKTSDQIKAVIEECVLVGLGGCAAEYINDGKLDYIPVGGSEHDIENIQALLCGITSKEFNKQMIVGAYLDRAVEILEERWPAVQALTKQLIENRHITADRVVAIIEENS